ncbi:sulfite exporter TauE/SafE family protein [Poriferisphaera corsica]|uniref:sulfite exporter TauE/SafE family protein n=1 Tax=Poriferisphaera corsica TaxID=2528020 RepID=UPI00190BD0B9|nr:sulfite exporter TauE/SafE family protein [Poriferisphaera corsica]
MLFVGSVSSGAVGFGVGLICIPLLVLGGVSLPSAITIMLMTMLFVNGVSCYYYRGHIHWPSICPVLVSHLIALPIGVATLYLLDTFNPDIAKAMVGVVVLLAVAMQTMLRVEPQDKLGRNWAYAAGGSSGYIEGLVGMGSPPLILYMMAHRWGMHRMRTFIWLIFLADIAPLLLMLWYVFGREIMVATFLGVLFFPVSFIGARVGNRLGQWLGTERLRVVMYMFLILLGLISIVIPFLH